MCVCGGGKGFVHSQRCTDITRADACEIATEKRLKGTTSRLRVSGRHTQSSTHGSKTSIIRGLKRTNSITKLQVMCQGVEVVESLTERN